MKLHLAILLTVAVPTVLSETRPSVLSEPRLDSALRVQHYHVDVKFVKLHTEEYPTRFSGVVKIKVWCCYENKNNRYIELHSKKRYNIKINDKSITVKEIGYLYNSEWAVRSVTYDASGDILKIELETPLKKGSTYEVTLRYDGEIDQMFGYVTAYWLKNHAYLVATNSERQIAFPCFDEPDMRATFQVTAGFSLGDGYAMVNQLGQTWNSGKDFPPSQVAFVVTNLHTEDVKVEFDQDKRWVGTFKIWVPETNPKNPNRPAGVRPSIDSQRKRKVDFIEEKTNLGFVVIPTKEEMKSYKWGLANISEDEIYEESEDKKLFNYYIRFTKLIFGGIISPDRWESLGYFNALAEYLARWQVGPEQIDNIIRVRWERPSENMDEIMEKGLDIFENDISDKNKGLLLFRMLHSFSEGDKFIEDIKNRLVKKYAYNYISLDELWDAFPDDIESKQREENLAVKTWKDTVHKYTKQTSYPVMNVAKFKKGAFLFQQEPFIGSFKERLAKNFECDKNGEKKIWAVPMSFEVFDLEKERKEERKIQSDQGLWMFFKDEDDYEMKYKLPTEAKEGQVVVFNTKCIGIFRLKYDDESWGDIGRLLKTNGDLLDPTTRACVIHDAFSLAWVGYHNYTKVLGNLGFLRSEDSDLVWHSFFYAASDVSEILQFSRDAYRKFQIYVNSLLSTKFNKKYAASNFFQRMNEDNQQKINTVDAFYMHWACIVAKIKLCATQAKKILDDWYKAGLEKKHPLKSKGDTRDYQSLLSTVYCTVLSEYTRYDNDILLKADFLFSLLSKTNQNIIYRDGYFEAFRCLTDSTTVNTFLEWVCSNDVSGLTLEDKQRVFLNIAKGKDSFEVAFEYLQEQLTDQIIPYHKSDEFLAELISTLTTRMTTEQVQEMDEFIRKTPELQNKPVITTAFEKGKAASELRQKWLQKNALVIKDSIENTFCRNNVCDF